MFSYFDWPHKLYHMLHIVIYVLKLEIWHGGPTNPLLSKQKAAREVKTNHNNDPPESAENENNWRGRACYPIFRGNYLCVQQAYERPDPQWGKPAQYRFSHKGSWSERADKTRSTREFWLKINGEHRESKQRRKNKCLTNLNWIIISQWTQCSSKQTALATSTAPNARS